MKQKQLLLLAMMLFNITLFAQNPHPEKDNTVSLQLKPQNSLNKNDTYFNEITLKYGALHLENHETEVYELTAAHYFAPNWGMKTGITQLKNAANMKHAWQMPVMFSLRTTPFTTGVESARIRDLFLLIFNLIPLQAEASAGITLGYLTPLRPQPEKTGEYDLHNRFMASLRGDVSLTFYVCRVGVNVSLAGQYLLSANFKKYQPNIYHPNHNKVSRSLFFPAIGISYRF